MPISPYLETLGGIILRKFRACQSVAISATARTEQVIVRLAKHPIPMTRLGAYLVAVFILSGMAMYEGYPYVPALGVAIGLLGLAAVIVAVRTDALTLWEKVGWICVASLLFYVEVHSIYVEQGRHDREQDAARQTQLKGFNDIGKGIQTSIAESDSNFAATIGKTNDVLRDITGGDSFGFVVPQAFGEQVPLLVWNHGNQPLQGVTVTVARTQEPDWGNAFYRPIFIGTIGPNDHAPVPGFLSPKPEERSGQDHYWIMIAAQNGTVSQSLYFRRNRKGTVPWAYSYLVTKDLPVGKAGIRFPKGVPKNATVMKPILHRGWSDEVDEPH